MKKEVNELRKEVKETTGYNLNQIDIIAFTEDFIDYDIYKNYENDRRTGRKPIDSGRITRKDEMNMKKEVSKMNLVSLSNLDNEILTEEEFDDLQEHELVKKMENLGDSASRSGCGWWDVELENGERIDIFTYH